jgi:hypothetical protein
MPPIHPEGGGRYGDHLDSHIRRYSTILSLSLIDFLYFLYTRTLTTRKLTFEKNLKHTMTLNDAN